MNNKTKAIIYVITGFLIVLTVLIYINYSKNNNLSKNLDKVVKKVENISLPEPISGPNREESAGNLSSSVIIELTNQERISDGESVLTENTLLDNAAERKINDMFQNQYFEHVSPVNGVDVSSFVLEENYQYAYVGENLAMGDFVSEKEMVQAWMDSPGHRENILGSHYTEIGVAVEKGIFQGRNTWIGVQVFAKTAPNCSVPNKSLLEQIEKLENNYKQIDDYNAQISNLQIESSKLISDGNNKINEGNKINSSDTGDRALAETYWNEGDKLYNEGVDKNNQANELINTVNKLLEDYPNLQEKIDNYNQQIDNYNQCISV